MKRTGFTLIELLIVITLIAILSLIAYPSYNSHIIRTRRIQIVALLLDRAVRMEEYYAIHNSYDGAQEKLSVDGDYYRIDIIPNGGRYLLKATPIGKQVKDIRCGSLTVDQDGNRASNGSADGLGCWL